MPSSKKKKMTKAEGQQCGEQGAQAPGGGAAPHLPTSPECSKWAVRDRHGDQQAGQAGSRGAGIRRGNQGL